MAVCIGEIGECGREKSQRRAGPSLRRKDEQRHMVFTAVFGRQPRRVDAALETGRDLPDDVCFPGTVLQIVAVKMNGAIEIGSAAPVRGLAAPCMAGDCARWQIDAAPVALVS